MKKILLVILMIAFTVGCGDQLSGPLPIRPLISHKGTSDVNDVLFIDNQEKILIVEAERFVSYSVDGKLATQSEKIDNAFDNWLQTASYSNDETCVFLGRVETGILCFDLKANEFVEDHNVQGSHFCYALPETNAYVTLKNDNVLTCADRQTGNETWAIKTRVDSTKCAHSIGFDAIALGELSNEGSGRVVLYRLADGEQKPTNLVHERSVRGIAFSPDSSLLVSTGDDGYLRVLDLKEQAIVWEQKNDVDGAFAVAVHPNNDYVAVGCMRGVKIWSLKEQRLVSSWNAHSWFVRCIRFSPEGRYLLTGSADDTAALWETNDLLGKLEYIKPF